MSTEKKLFQLIKHSDTKAFETIFRLYYKPLKVFTNSFLHDSDLSDDMVQEIFVQLWESRKKLDLQSGKSYLYNALKNKALNHLRHTIVKEKYANEIINTNSDYPENQSDNRDLIIQIMKAVERLPEQCKRVFIMSRMHGLMHKEIAEELNISIKTVKNHIGKALKILRDELNGVYIALIISSLQYLLEKI